MLMLSGAQDEVVPKDHMRRLWEVVAKRGEKKKINGSEYKTGLERAKYIEFVYGDHSTFEFYFIFSILDVYHIPDNTCAQPGYWSAIAEFMLSVVRATQEESPGPKPF
jgi:hypothetical protein